MFLNANVYLILARFVEIINQSSEHIQCMYPLWQYGLWSFQTGGAKLERFLPKNQNTENNFENFENWTNVEPQQLAKIRVNWLQVFKVDYFILPLFLVPKLRSVAQNEWKKREKPKKFQKPKSCV